MKKIVFISEMAFDANVSIIKELRNYYDVFFFTRLKESLVYDYGVKDVPDDIFCTAKIPDSKKFDYFLDSNKTYLLRDHSIAKEHFKSYWNKFRQDLLLLKRVKKINPDYIFIDNNKLFFTCYYYRKIIIHLKHDPFAHSGEKTITGMLSALLMKKTAHKYVVFNDKQYIPFLQRKKLKKKDVCCSFLSVYEYYHVYDKKVVNNSVNNKINILFWGRISPYKGIEFLLKGFLSYIEQSKKDDVSLTIAGKGDFDFDINCYINKCPHLRVINRFIPTDELVDMIKDSSLIVCPYTDATQSGVVMTAFAYKKPVLATNVGGLPEMLCNGKAGIIVEPKSAEEIFNGIKQFVDNPLKNIEFKQEINRLYYNKGEKSWYVAVKRIVDFIEEKNN